METCAPVLFSLVNRRAAADLVEQAGAVEDGDVGHRVDLGGLEHELGELGADDIDMYEI